MSVVKGPKLFRVWETGTNWQAGVLIEAEDSLCAVSRAASAFVSTLHKNDQFDLCICEVTNTTPKIHRFICKYSFYALVNKHPLKFAEVVVG